MENENEVQSIASFEAVPLPLYVLQTALTVASKEETRYYLNGVYVHSRGSELRVAATDGTRLFVHSQPLPHGEGVVVPAWLSSGVIIPREGLKERLALLAKDDQVTAKIDYAINAPHLLLSDIGDSCVFKLKPVDGTFPDYQTIIDGLSSFGAHKVEDMHSTSYNSGYLKDVGVVAKMLDAKSVRIFASEKPNDPTLITFPENPMAILIVMPMNEGSRAIGTGASQIVSGAISGTVAALRAHRTRWADKAEQGNKAAEKRVEEYDARIAAILAAANPVPALPAPEPVEPEVEPPTDAQAEMAAVRQSLSNGQKAKTWTRFVGDVNALLNVFGGLTLGKLAEGAPVEDWFDRGLTAKETAEAALDWRKASEVLPADQLSDGDAERPIALVLAGRAPVEPQPEPEAAEQPEAEAEQPEAETPPISEEEAVEKTERARQRENKRSKKAA